MIRDCPICSGEMKFCFTANVLQNYPAEYDVCSLCGYLCVRNPHWLGEAYASAIAAADTGLVMRNITLAPKVASFLFWVMCERGQGRYLDAAGGYGMLTRLMRDFGFDFYWADKHCANLLARGFEYGEHLKGCRAVTAIEVMEHLAEPLAFVDEALRMAGANTLLFTTELYEGDPPKRDWWYYAFNSGQHIGFFTKSSFEALGRKLGLNFYSVNGLHILSREVFNPFRLQLATHTWVSNITFLLIRSRLKSKTMSDHQLIMNGK